jgi:hypothetical protein
MAPTKAYLSGFAASLVGAAGGAVVGATAGAVVGAAAGAVVGVAAGVHAENSIEAITSNSKIFQITLLANIFLPPFLSKDGFAKC